MFSQFQHIFCKIDALVFIYYWVCTVQSAAVICIWDSLRFLINTSCASYNNAPQTLLPHLTASWVDYTVRWNHGFAVHTGMCMGCSRVDDIHKYWKRVTTVWQFPPWHLCLPPNSIHDNPRCGRECKWCKTISILFSLETVKLWMNIALGGKGYCGIHTGREGVGFISHIQDIIWLGGRHAIEDASKWVLMGV